jgi:hypothetical protein
VNFVRLMLLWILLLYPTVLGAQVPTESDKSLFEDWMGDYLLDENAITSYCVKYTVVASEVYHQRPETIETSVSYLAVDKVKKRVRYDFIGESVDEDGNERVLGIRHLQIDKEYYFGQGESVHYRLSKLDSNFLKNWDGRPVNPMLLPFSGMNASRSNFGLDSLFGIEVCSVDDIRVAWSTEKFLTGCVNGKTDNSMTCIFDRQYKKPIESSVYLHPRSLAMDNPENRFRPTLKTEAKWREIPKLGWRPVEAVDYVDIGSKKEPVKQQLTTKVTWWSDEIPEQVFAPDDLKPSLEFPTAMQKLFK